MLAWRTPGKGAVPGETGVREGFLEEIHFGVRTSQTQHHGGGRGKGSQVEGPARA